jgi:hypothetical protein
MESGRHLNEHTEELRQALERLDRRAAGSVVLQEAVAELRRLPRHDQRNKSNREARARAQVSLAHAMYAAGRVTRAEYFYFLTMPLISLVHESRWTDGEYNEDLKPISDRIKQIEIAHGLAKEEFWPPDAGPPEYQALNRDYETLLDRKQGEVFREFGEQKIAELWDQKRDQFDELFEKGRVAIFEKEDREAGLAELIQVYEREARSCAEANAYYAACVALGAAMETRLLFQCVKNSDEVSTAVDRLPKKRRPRSKKPIDWNLSSLLEVCSAAGWLPPIESELGTHLPEGWGHMLRRLRNLLHPGRHLLDRPRATIGREEFEDAQAAYTLVKAQLGQQATRTIDS